MGQILVKGGRLVNPASATDEICDILIKDGVVEQIGKDLACSRAEVIDASGRIVMPGFIDLHVHLREPGFEYKETIETGARAAAHGGVTTICPMPNTDPVIDSPERVRDLLRRAENVPVRILPVGAVTVGQKGTELADFRGMKQAGAVALSEDGKSVMDVSLFRKAMQEAASCGLPMFSHCEERSLVAGGVMNAGKRAEELNLPGITNAVEDIIAARDILLAKETGCRLHLCHCSTADSMLFLEMAQRQKLPVTGEVCPHHFSMCDEDITEDHGRFKMNPPLRSRQDMMALRDALKTGTVQVISTDHAPHGAEEKDQSMLHAPFGIVGIENSFALGYTELVRTGYLTLMQLVEKMSVNPAGILGIDRGNIAVGKAADIVIADVEREYAIDPDTFFSKGKNTPFAGRRVYGEVLATILAGEIVYRKNI